MNALKKAVEKQAKDAVSDASSASASAKLVTEISTRVNKSYAELQVIKAMPPADSGPRYDELCKSMESIASDEADVSKNAQSANYFSSGAKASAAAASNNVKALADTKTTISTEVAALPAIDPPISNIGQSIQFILMYGGGVTPTWSFATFKGPTGSLLSASGNRTHILNITLGPTATGTYSAPSASVSQNQLYLLLNNLLPPVTR